MEKKSKYFHSYNYFKIDINTKRKQKNIKEKYQLFDIILFILQYFEIFDINYLMLPIIHSPVKMYSCPTKVTICKEEG